MIQCSGEYHSPDSISFLKINITYFQVFGSISFHYRIRWSLSLHWSFLLLLFSNFEVTERERASWRETLLLSFFSISGPESCARGESFPPILLFFPYPLRKLEVIGAIFIFVSLLFSLLSFPSFLFWGFPMSSFLQMVREEELRLVLGACLVKETLLWFFNFDSIFDRLSLS